MARQLSKAKPTFEINGAHPRDSILSRYRSPPYAATAALGETRSQHARIARALSTPAAICAAFTRPDAIIGTVTLLAVDQFESSLA